MEILIKILPVYLLFFTGIILQKLNIVSKINADFLLRLVFYFTLPALVLKSLSSVSLDFKTALLPVISALIIFITWLISTIYVKIKKMKSEIAGVVFTATMILNIGFLIPFVHSVYGDFGLSRLILFDFSNGILAYSLVYAIAVKHGQNGAKIKEIKKKLLQSPPLYALILALLLNSFSLKIPSLILPFIEIAGNLTIPLLLLAVGVFFEPRISMLSELITSIFIRMGIGFLLAILFISLFKVEGINKIIVLLGATAPAGFNTLTFASIEKLDKNFAASLVSFSILLSLLWVPIILLIL